VRFYGVDLSIGGPRGYTPTPVALEAVLAYLIRVDRTSAQRAQTTLQPFLAQLPGAASLSPAEHDRLSGAIDDVMSVLVRKRRTFIAATSDAEYDWAQRNAVVARQSELEFRVALPGAPPAAILPGDWRAAEERNRALADNVRWVLAQEGPAGRVLVFAHNAHIMNARLEGGIWNAFKRAPNAMGLYLRSTLGNSLVIVGSVPPGVFAGSRRGFRTQATWTPRWRAWVCRDFCWISGRHVLTAPSPRGSQSGARCGRTSPPL
jgi:erythromycin esterase